MRYRLVENDIALDPVIESIETGGHVPGQQSVLVRMPRAGAVLLAINAVPLSSMVNADTRWVMPMDIDETGTRAITRKLAEVVTRKSRADDLRS